MEEDVIYVGMAERLKAALIDVFVVFLLAILAGWVIKYFQLELSQEIRIALFVLIFLLYEPLMISFSGSTLGQKSVKIKVVQSKNGAKKIILPLAILRFVIKMVLGWISLVSIASDSKSRAIHDFAAQSVVVYVEE